MGQKKICFTELVEFGKLYTISVVLVVILEHFQNFWLLVLKSKGPQSDLAHERESMGYTLNS